MYNNNLDLKKLPKAIVLLATYNGQSYLAEQIQSILSQKFVDVEIYIRDDGSLDDTAKISEGFSKKHENIHILSTDISTGSAARNFRKIFLMFSNVRNHYIFLADQDDIWKPYKLHEAIKNLVNGADLVSGSLECFGHGINKTYVIKKDAYFRKFDHFFQGLSAGCTYGISPKLYNLVQNELFNSWYNENDFSHDWLIYTIARLHEMQIIHLSDAHIKYRQHSTNVQGSLSGLKGFYYRAFNINQNWYINQIKRNYVLAQVAPAEQISLKAILNKRFFFILINCLQFRRNKIQSLYLSLYLLLRKK